MATVYSSTIILQPVSTLGASGYPTSSVGSNGFTTVTANYGDTVVVTLRSGSSGSSAGTSNYGNTPNGNTNTGGTFVSPSTSFSSTSQTIAVSITNVQYDGLISFWCGPTEGGSSVGWRGRVSVTVNKDTSVNLNSTSVSINSTATSYQNGLTNGGAGTIYYVFNANNIANGTDLDALRTGGDSRYIARTFTTATSKPFSTSGTGAQITNDLPTTGNTKTYYLYAANLLGRDSEYMSGTSYSVTRAAAQDTTPNTPSFTNVTQALTSTAYTENWQTSGVTSGVQVTWTASTTAGTVQLSTQETTGYVSGATGIQRTNQQTGYVKLTTTGSQGTAHTVTVSGGGVSAQWVVTTISQAQQGTQSGGGTGQQYGLKIQNSQEQVIISDTSKVGNVRATRTFSIVGQSSPQQFFVDSQTGGAVDCSDSTQMAIIIQASAFFRAPYYIRRTSAQQGFELYPYSSATSQQTVTGVITLVEY